MVKDRVVKHNKDLDEWDASQKRVQQGAAQQGAAWEDLEPNNEHQWADEASANEHAWGDDVQKTAGSDDWASSGEEQAGASGGPASDKWGDDAEEW